MKYQCYICDATFDEPSVHSYIEDMNGEHCFQRFSIPVCPCCGSEEIEGVPDDDDLDDDPFAPEPEWVRERRIWEELHT